MKKMFSSAVRGRLYLAPLIAIALGLLFALLPPQSQTAQADGTAQTEGVLTYEVDGDGIIVITACDYGAGATNEAVQDAITSLSALAARTDTVMIIGDGISGPFSCNSYDPDAQRPNLTSITIPANVIEISYCAFADSSLETLTFTPGSQLENIGVGAFMNCAGISALSIPNSVTVIDASAFIGCTGLNTVAFEPESSLQFIESGAFMDCTSISKISIPDSLMWIGPDVFANCENLSEVNIPDGDASLKIGPSAFQNCMHLTDILIPQRVHWMEPDTFAADPPYVENSASYFTFPITIHAEYDSYALWWAKQQGYPCDYRVMPGQGTMQANTPGLMYKHIPYEFIAKTRVPDNEDLRFWLDKPLPTGLYLVDGVSPLRSDAPANAVPGTIYGAPLDYAAFEAGVTFKMYAQHINVTNANFRAEAEFTIRLADTPDDAGLASNVNSIYDFEWDNDYNRDGHIGEYNPATNKYEIIAYYDAVGNQIMHIDGPFELFDSFWIDGIKKIPVIHYTAEDGSTRVVILAQTIQSLDDGEHTAAAVFRRANVESFDPYYEWNRDGADENGFTGNTVVVAQRFTVELTDRPASAGNDDLNGGRGPGGGGSVLGPASDSVTVNTGANNAENVNNAENAAGTNDADPGNAGNAGGTSPGGTADANAGTEAGDGETADATATTDEEAGGTGAVSGLPADGNGRFYFTLDGSGAPLELRIDIPLPEYENLYFDGAPWSRGADYAVREGSTILTITAERLERCEAGLHTLSARFESETVDIVFELIKTAANGTAPATAATGEANGASGTDGANAANTAPPFMPIIIAIIILVALCVLYAVFKRKRAA